MTRPRCAADYVAQRVSGPAPAGGGQRASLSCEKIHGKHRHRTRTDLESALIHEELGVVVRRGLGRILAFGGDAQEYVEAWHLLGEEGKILRSARQLRSRNLAVGSAFEDGDIRSVSAALLKMELYIGSIDTWAVAPAL